MAAKSEKKLQAAASGLKYEHDLWRLELHGKFSRADTFQVRPLDDEELYFFREKYVTLSHNEAKTFEVTDLFKMDRIEERYPDKQNDPSFWAFGKREEDDTEIMIPFPFTGIYERLTILTYK